MTCLGCTVVCSFGQTLPGKMEFWRLMQVSSSDEGVHDRCDVRLRVVCSSSVRLDQILPSASQVFCVCITTSVQSLLVYVRISG